MFLFCSIIFVNVFLDSDGDDEGENTVKKPETVNFVVMLKKNNKPQVNFYLKFFFFEFFHLIFQFHDMAVSSTSEMALRLKAREQVNLAE